MIKLLIKGNVIVDWRDDTSRSPVSLAKYHDHCNVVALVLEHSVIQVRLVSESSLHIYDYHELLTCSDLGGGSLAV